MILFDVYAKLQNPNGKVHFNKIIYYLIFEVESESNMQKKKRNVKLVLTDKSLINNFKRIKHLIRNYSPEKEDEINDLLEILQGEIPEEGTDWIFLEKLSEFWRAKMQFYLDETWGFLCKRIEDNLSNKFILSAINKISQIAKEGQREFEKNLKPKQVGRFFSASRYDINVFQLQSHFDDPPLPGEIRFIVKEFLDEMEKSWLYKVVKIDESDKGRDLKNVTPKEEISDEFPMAQVLQDMGLVLHRNLGRIAFEEWNLPLIETEKKQIGVPVEELLVLFGGCPYGRVSDHDKGIFNKGFNIKDRHCECPLRFSCIGCELVSAGTLGAFAKQLRIIKKGKAELWKFLKIEKKLLDLS